MRRSRGRDVSGILLLDKPVGISSNAALQRARRIFDARKAGHTGNLDVLASGLLPVCFGEATKVSAFLLDADKAYEAEITFGVTTTTADAEGEVLSRMPVPALAEAQMNSLLAEFVGDLRQIPPMYSALKYRGERLYRLAQQGIDVERVPRLVRIKTLELLAVQGAKVRIRVACTKGTYIRTLAADIGARLGCGAFLSELRRIQSGPFQLVHARTLVQLDECRQDQGFAELDSQLRSIDSALLNHAEVALAEDMSLMVLQGQAVRAPNAPAPGLVRLYGEGRGFLGIGQVLEDGRIAPRRLLQVAVA